MFAGQLDGQVDLGGVTYSLRPQEDGAQVCVAKLDGNAQYVYANTTGFAYFRGLTADGRGNAAASGTHGNGSFPVMDEYRSDGSLFREVQSETLIPLEQEGAAGPVLVDWPGNLYWTFSIGVDNFASYLVKLRAN